MVLVASSNDLGWETTFCNWVKILPWIRPSSTVANHGPFAAVTMAAHQTQPPDAPARTQANQHLNRHMWQSVMGDLQNPTGANRVVGLPFGTWYKPTRPTSTQISQKFCQNPSSLPRILPKITLLSKIPPRFGKNIVIFAKSNGDLKISAQIWPRSCDLYLNLVEIFWSLVRLWGNLKSPTRFTYYHCLLNSNRN